MRGLIDKFKNWLLRAMTCGGTAPAPYCGQLCWWRDGRWVPLTPDEVHDYISREAW